MTTEALDCPTCGGRPAPTRTDIDRTRILCTLSCKACETVWTVKGGTAQLDIIGSQTHNG